jgi:predicted 2-oxoglutarate/Fe(II)-dependent dioxygenase YbiX
VTRASATSDLATRLPRPAPDVLALAPGIIALRAFTADEAAAICTMAEEAEPWRAAVINGDRAVDRTVRDAEVLDADASPRLFAMCHHRLIALLGVRARELEPDAALGEMQIVRYAVGGTYVDHRDTPDAEVTSRVLSLVGYLNDDLSGGATVFPESGLRVEPVAGIVLAFSPLLLHRAEPVTAGRKIAITAWYHRVTA